MSSKFNCRIITIGFLKSYPLQINLFMPCPFSARDGWTFQEGILLLGSCIHSPSRWAEKSIYDQETPLGARSKKLCIETTPILGWTVIPKANREEKDIWEEKRVVKKEKSCWLVTECRPWKWIWYKVLIKTKWWWRMMTMDGSKGDQNLDHCINNGVTKRPEMR